MFGNLSPAARAAAAIVLLFAIVFAGCKSAPVPREKAAEPEAPARELILQWPADPLPVDRGWAAEGHSAAIVTGREETAEIGLQTLLAGGNAFDAGAATLLALTVTQHSKFHFGGEVPIMIYTGRYGTVEVLSGVGRAPEAATREYFAERGGIPAPGAGDPSNAAVPGAFHAILTMLDLYGTMTFEEVAMPTLALLESFDEGWQVDLAATMVHLIAADVETRRAGGDRSAGIAAVIEEFYGYEGAVSRGIVEWCAQNGGLISADDLAWHETLIEPPVRSTYRDYTILKCDTWTQGPYLCETLNILEGFDIAAMGHNSADYTHTVIEALKLGLADRDRWFGDPLYVWVPLSDMLSPDYTALRRALIDPERASVEVLPGDPEAMAPLIEESAEAPGAEGPIDDTTTCIVRDRWGNIMVATPSGWGGTLVGDTGVHIGSRLSSFNIWEGHPNVIEPGKRPRITLTPTLVMKDGEPAAAISVAGGDFQDQIACQLFLSVFEFGLSPAEAVTLPRFGTRHFTGSFSQPAPEPASLELSDKVPPEVIEELKSRGHDVRVYSGPYWSPSMMVFDESGLIRAAGDPAAQRFSAGY